MVSSIKKTLLLLSSLTVLGLAATTSTNTKKVNASPSSLVKTSHVSDDTPVENTSTSPYNSFIMAITMIGLSEIGDKTFLIAALMAMRNPRLLVFFAASSSLAIMTVLSGIAGHSFSYFISEKYTGFLAGILFLVFGYKLTKEGLEMSKDADVSEEMAEVEEEIAVQSMNETNNKIEKGPSLREKLRRKRGMAKYLKKCKDLASYILSPVFVQVFVMVFLGELGDRSQISIIALASNNNYWYAIAGAVLGHVVCSGVAVVGGRYLATKISMRTMTLVGALLFYTFGIIYLYQSYTYAEITA
ncbi:putative ribosome biosynthesis protein GDT1 NDAI_0C05580 [Naumovozyma dairenensis CBS 421]|uniref:GDT1 family protein n=1 Tax=Naumovozyma dairenensis (strain ATCC 10597 / BCRC 20456 / CBS 421 / NBRC 0211 / NRRL Y-12639) TaxID=1071378 RepID=G0W8V6_NAUDC|nr:hypothetical protein NDAI_0C05580 [Naumovozyma dairenensis CBS 421]CCD24217.1 hypothetical protein NDAI_0C05580 [Naumovozyma dairenensis CBS 421]